uniref:Odorant-binding protein 21 n=1 Tax=Pyrrhalta aenescens TaxID=281545 RepID=A0A1J0KKK7_9CUCU|nr:odorant-binding protein 21 [Pyrrhalta aenescens]
MLRVMFLVFVIFSTTTSSPVVEMNDPKVKTIIATLHQLCVSQTGVQQSSIEEGKKGILDRDPKLMEYWTCVWTTSGLMDKKGNIDYDLFQALCPADIYDVMKKLLSTCHDKASDEKVLTKLVLKMTQCVATTDFEHFVIF